jgi:uncharacterized protein (DUF2126 family)
MSIRVALDHVTRYQYDKPVILGPHVVRLRPAPHTRTPIISYSLDIKPAGHFINWQQDPFGNWLARLIFPEPVTELSVAVDLVCELTVINPFDFFVEDYAENFPFTYSDELKRELAPYLDVTPPGPLLEAWLKQHKPVNQNINDALVSINQAVQSDIDYRVRLEPGVQTSEDTLSLASGSCRDSGWLLVEIMRHYGLAARFVSGYLVQLVPDIKAVDGATGPEADFTDLHAWTEVYLPGAGWVGLDPTSGLFAGEGHIPLACTPLPSSAAPISGGASAPATQFDFHNRVSRFEERPRVTHPYTDATWNQVLALGEAVDNRLDSAGLTLTMGGEPTFVSSVDFDAPEWNEAALGEHKLERATALHAELLKAFAPKGVPSFAQGKWYPGEPTPRWALVCHWRDDDQPLLEHGDAIALPGDSLPPADENDARRLMDALIDTLGVASDGCRALHEDPLHSLHLESLLPEADSLTDLNLDDSRSRRLLVEKLERGLDRPVGWMLPLEHDADRWQSGVWPQRRSEVFLVPGDSPAGLRLPLDSLPEDEDSDAEARAMEEDTFEAATPLPDAGAKPAAHSEVADGLTRSTLCIECREDRLYAFLPPLKSAAAWVELVQAVAKAAADTGLRPVLEGYEPPHDMRLKSFRITPDPGVIEVNIHPSLKFSDLVSRTETLYEAARRCQLTAEKFMVDGRHTGTGGGNHVTLGGPTPAQSPFLQRPHLLGSLITYWQHHPSLSYLFSGVFVGPTSQAPRVDEARVESLFELELALSRLPAGEEERPWLVDRLLRNLLIDLTGNTHRAEICIDKLYSPAGPTGRLGIVELRAFEMAPHARMAIVQALLVRALVVRFAESPYSGDLVRWGTELHDRFMLPHYLEADLADVVRDLAEHQLPLPAEWFNAFTEFRFPVYGTRVVDGVTLELRAAIEPWHVLGEEASAAGMARYVDSSMERIQVKVTGMVEGRHEIRCNGSRLPLRSTGTAGEYVVGVRFRAWQPPFCLHPDLPVDAPLIFDIVDVWSNRSLGGCAYHVSDPGGRSYEDVPVNANVAEARRLARFEEDRHTVETASIKTPVTTTGVRFESTSPVEVVTQAQALETSAEFPHTADLRRHRSRHARDQARR